MPKLRLIEFGGETLKITEWAQRYNTNYSKLYRGLKRGLSLGEVLLTPPKIQRPKPISPIRKRADELVRLCGMNVQARERSVLLLMGEYGISDISACGYFEGARRRAKRLRRPHGATV